MLRLTCRVVGALLALVVLAGSAAADCAWVLWRNTAFPQKQDWTVLSAWATKRECEVDGRSRIDRELYVYTEDDIGNQTALFCLPDSFDPRGPKGGGR